ncbi:hypothetical protein DPMN_093100 [Dreissena polymorpha]|uniref:TIR domain-containing protein n=1 Tax=Dreissena polymorpha TaxID=45954 RepID=A0A9D4L3C3_DREPO|nr:hypothetical protein DPMN_093100 [Dreissena polymorpha]
MAVKVQILLVIITSAYFIPVQCQEITCLPAPADPSDGTCSSEYGIYTCSGMIPGNIPEGVTRVHVICIKARMITPEAFHGLGWGNVTYLQLYSDVAELADNAFRRLKRLKELHIHVAKLKLQDGVFRYLVNLELLSLNDCYRLNSTEFVQAMANESVMPHLTHLYLRRTSKIEKYNFDLNESFFKIFKRPIKILDLSDTAISSFDMSILDTEPDLGMSIESINVSHTYYINHNTKVSQNRTLRNLEVIDVSGNFIDGKTLQYNSVCNPLTRVITNIKDIRFTIDFNGLFKLVQHMKTFYADELCAISQPMFAPYVFKHIKNVTFALNDPTVVLNVERLFLRRNNVHYLDVEAMIEMPSVLKFLDLSENGVEYINPRLLKNCPLLTHLVVSNNKLGMMQMNNQTDFECLLESLHNLQHISLDNNDISVIPNLMFATNVHLQTLNVAFNRLTDLRFLNTNMTKLEFLDLRYNFFTTIDASTRNILTDLNLNNISFSGNKLLCISCSDFDSVNFVLSKTNRFQDFDKLQCTNKDHLTDRLSETVLKTLKRDCALPLIIGVAVTSVAIVLLATGMTLLLCHHKRKRKRYINLLNQAITQLQIAERFAVYLIYSSSDEVFVKNNVYAPMNETFKKVVGVERDLLCIGDEQFKVGWNIYREIYRCMGLSHVAVLVLSEGFANSAFCDQELDIAIQLKKPIVLLLKDRVNIDELSEPIQVLYRTNVRILFEYELGEYVLKTTWDNVCRSILQMI